MLIWSRSSYVEKRGSFTRHWDNREPTERTPTYCTRSYYTLEVLTEYELASCEDTYSRLVGREWM